MLRLKRKKEEKEIHHSPDKRAEEKKTQRKD
jgi:hypothetical protein